MSRPKVRTIGSVLPKGSDMPERMFSLFAHRWYDSTKPKPPPPPPGAYKHTYPDADLSPIAPQQPRPQTKRPPYRFMSPSEYDYKSNKRDDHSEATPVARDRTLVADASGGISFVKVIDAGPRYTTVEADDGKTYTLKGDRNWRNNNPGNIEYGDFAKSLGAIGSDGRFAVFPSIDQGYAAQEQLQFGSKNYSGKSIEDAISRYAPAFENNSAAYAAEVAAAAGVPVTTKMSDLSPEQRKAFLAAQHRVEGMKPGTIMGADGVPVSPEVAAQFAAVRLPPANIPNAKAATGDGVRAYQQQLAQRGFDPGPIDGVRGPRTTAAVKAFQQANGLTVDGIVGPKTMAALQGQQRPRTQPQPLVGARQPANILAPPPLIQPQDMRDAFFSPLPAPKPLTPPRPEGGMLGGTPMGGPPPLPAMQPPVPMPGRPAGLNAAPPPIPTAAPKAPAQKLLRLPSGAMIAPGVYDNAKSGIPYTVTEGPNGTAVIHSQRSGFVDLGKEINAPTILGGIIRSKIPEVAQSAVENFGPALDNVKNTAANAINTVAPAVQGLGNTVGGFFGGLFGGGQPPQVPNGMLGRNPAGGMYRPPMPLTPSPMLRNGSLVQIPPPRQFTRAPSGRTAASVGETADRVWLEAKGLI